MKARYCAVWMCVFFTVAGMGGIVGDEANKLPKAVENFRVAVTDVDGYSTTISQVTIGESIFVAGAAGKGTHIIDFEQIQKATFLPAEEKMVSVTITFRDGTQLKLSADARKKLKGKSKYGIYSIPLAEVREIVFIEKLKGEKQE